MMHKSKLLLAGATVLIAIAGIVAYQFRRAARTAPGIEGSSAELTSGLPVLWNAPTFEFRDQNGRVVTERDLTGHVWIADFIYTRCTTACPVLTTQLVLLQHAIKDAGVQFISFSVDPEYDTPPVLKKYADAWNPVETRWRLLSTESAALFRLAKDMRATVQETADPDDPILHTNRMFLIDQEGRVRGIYDSTDSVELDRLVADASSLEGRGKRSSASQPAVPPRASDSGQELFSSLGCAPCHSQPRIAPPLEGLLGAQVRIDSGEVILADEAYLRQSILDPLHKVVHGYGRTMPSYRGHLTDAQLESIVGYLKTLKSERVRELPPATQSAEPALAIDLICDMEVTVVADTPRAEFEGRTYYFCCESCRDKFAKTPLKYIKK